MIEPTGKHTDEIEGVIHEIWKRRDHDQEFYGDEPIGAMWYCKPEDQHYYTPGPDGRTLFIKLPNGHVWNIDSRAHNCDSPCVHCGIAYKDHGTEHKYEDAKPHKCWIRQGTPPNITVDKGGITCGAGAGSIASGREGEPDYYHGFLQNGQLT
jgi:hypothetical protein